MHPNCHHCRSQNGSVQHAVWIYVPLLYSLWYWFINPYAAGCVIELILSFGISFFSVFSSLHCKFQVILINIIIKHLIIRYANFIRSANFLFGVGYFILWSRLRRIHTEAKLWFVRTCRSQRWESSCLFPSIAAHSSSERPLHRQPYAWQVPWYIMPSTDFHISVLPFRAVLSSLTCLCKQAVKYTNLPAYYTGLFKNQPTQSTHMIHRKNIG